MNVRFSQIIKTAGRPETYLALIEPKKDQALQKLVKAGRVMTVHQNAPGGKPDYGEAGFKEGVSRQYLVFPKSIKRFAKKRIIGIKYDLLQDAPPPGKPKKAPSPRKPKSRPPTTRRRKTKSRPAAPKGKIIAFPAPPKDKDESGQIKKIKTRIRQAMKALEAGKQVAAFNLLKQILEN